MSNVFPKGGGGKKTNSLDTFTDGQWGEKKRGRRTVSKLPGKRGMGG